MLFSIYLLSFIFSGGGFTVIKECVPVTLDHFHIHTFFLDICKPTSDVSCSFQGLAVIYWCFSAMNVELFSLNHAPVIR